METAKLDRLAYTCTQTHTQAHSLNPSLFSRGNALFVPGHLVKTLTADLLLSPAMVINHHTPLPNIHTVTHTGRNHQTIPVNHARYHLYIFYGRIVHHFFISMQSLGFLYKLFAWPYQQRVHGGCWAFLKKAIDVKATLNIYYLMLLHCLSFC